ncbi:MAG TPA: ligase-associated DNA damage response exonuclease [Gammaproteobacteria bacterium]|nr:ligase-associated DNA damage response exonuclease [Gammaproteobacteria bacterium]
MSSQRPDLIQSTSRGLYCPAGDFYIDPWQPVDRAVLTHAHGDHARPGHARYLAARAGAPVLRARLGEIALDTLDYGETLEVGGVKLSLHPAGHVLGSAQVRVEHRGEVWVTSGDYKLELDPTCAAFEPLRCAVFVTESTFGLPVFRWRAAAQVLDEVNAWWRANADAGRAAVVFAYALGKAQRLIASVDASIGPIVCHGAVEALNRAYRAAGVRLPETLLVTDLRDQALLSRALVVAPPSAQGTPWLKRFGDYADAFASGWMQLRGTRRRRAVDRGFVLSDHADWPGLLHAIEATGAGRVRVTHGQVTPLVRWLAEHDLDAAPLASEFEGEHDEGPLSDAEPA